MPQEPLEPSAEQSVTEPAERRATTDAHVVTPQLFVVLECARPHAGGSRHSLAGVDRVVIGRGKDRSAERLFTDGARALDIRVPDRRLSSRHACLTRQGDRFLLEDLGSRNGTLVNGSPVAGGVPLVEGDILQTGETVLLYRAAVEVPLGAQPDFAWTDDASHVSLHTLDAKLSERGRRLERIAQSDLPVLLLGETGTGKEVLARAVHRWSRRPGAFVAVNCGALPATLLEAQLFGHVRGAFSGAVTDAPGLLRSADRGTLFLDEIADLPLPSQVALLRALQEREVVPVGGVRPVPVDLRVVAATHRVLDDLVARHEFRRDLHARLAGFTFSIPALRDRRADVGVLLAGLEASRTSQLTPDAGRALVRYDWPSNVRELRHAFAAAAALAGGGPIAVDHLPRSVAEAACAAPLGADPLQGKLLSSLGRHRGNVSQVARELGTARMQVHRWMRRFAIDPRSFRR